MVFLVPPVGVVTSLNFSPKVAGVCPFQYGLGDSQFGISILEAASKAIIAISVQLFN